MDYTRLVAERFVRDVLNYSIDRTLGNRAESRATKRAGSSVWHSQTSDTRKPIRLSLRIARASLKRFAKNLSRQKHSFVIGMVARLQPVC